jgi:hypothetical protein
MTTADHPDNTTPENLRRLAFIWHAHSVSRPLAFAADRIEKLEAALLLMVDAGREASVALGELGFSTNDLTAAAENAVKLLEPSR